MRLRRLDLIRYGKFTGTTLDFGARVPDQPDLHIVYGPNEAGKSTAFAAFLDLLFGIDVRSRYNFLHPYPTMRIGAALEFAGELRTLVRIKRPQRSLLDSDDQPVGEHVIQGELGGLDRAAYRSMFSLDDETLEAGGESILASKGDLGQLLFSASAGLADLSRTLAELRAEADGFNRSRTSELALFKQELAKLKEQRDGIDTFAAEYARLVQARDQASVQYETAMAEWNRLRTRMDEIQRHLTALPRLAALRSLRERLAPLAELPAAPRGWAAELPELQRQETQLRTSAENLDDEIERLSAEVSAIVVDETAWRLAGRLDHLADLRARHRTADLDLPERGRELREVELGLASLLDRLGRAGEADPARLLIDARTIAALRDLIEKRSGIETAVAAAQDELSEALHRLGEAKAAHQEAAAGAPDEARIAVVETTLARLRGSDHEARRQVAARAAAARATELADRIAGLLPWQGDADQLAVLRVPDSGTIGGWKRADERLRGLVDRHQAEIARLEDDRVRLAAEQAAIGEVAGVVSDQAAAAVRGTREQAWAEHRRRLDAASADLFEAALRRDDLVTAARLGHEREVARLHDTAKSLAVCQAALDQERTRLAAALDSREGLAATIAAAMPFLPEDTAAGQLEPWLSRRERALESRAALREAERDRDAAAHDAAAARARLLAALEAAAVPADASAGWDALLAAAQSAVERAARRTALAAAVAERAHDVTLRERALQKAATADRGWQAAWREACSSGWLGEAVRTPAEVREVFSVLEGVRLALDRRAGLASRIRDMAADQAAFAQELAAIAADLGLDPAGRPALDVATEIEDRIHAARAARSARDARAAALEAAQDRRRVLGDAMAVHARRCAEMTGFFAVGSLAEVSGVLSDIEWRDSLLRQAEEAVRDTLDIMGMAEIAAAEAVLDRFDRDVLAAELTDLQARFEDLDRRRQDLYVAKSQAADRIEAVGGDDAAARIEETRRTVLLEIEGRARRHLGLRIGIAAAERALRAYRDGHRSSMMAAASRAFSLISRGAYRGLSTQAEKDGEILIAVGADGASKIAADLSKGTRFQLYLALRAAGYQEFCKIRPTVPFISDDIMETFDDFRAEETFRLFMEMANIGQVIYLTHHLHLCDIARRLHQGIRVHSLAEGQPSSG